MSWKEDLLGEINTAISRRQNAVFAVHSVEQKEWGEFIVGDIFSTLHLFKHQRLDFVVVPKTYENIICVGTILEKKEDIKGYDDMTGTNRRVTCKEFGAGEIISFGHFGQLSIAFVKFDGSSLDGTFVLVDDLKPEITDKNDQKLNAKQEDRESGNNGTVKIDDTERKLAHAKELERIQADALAEAKEIEDMSNETLVEEFEHLIRNGAGPGYRRVVFMKREMTRRMNRGDHL